MSDPSPWIREDYAEYLRHFDEVQTNGGMPPWFAPLEFDAWLGRQSMRYLQGRARPSHPI